MHRVETELHFHLNPHGDNQMESRLYSDGFFSAVRHHRGTSNTSKRVASVVDRRSENLIDTTRGKCEG